MDATSRGKRMIAAHSCVLHLELNGALGVFAHQKPRLLVDVDLMSTSCKHIMAISPRFLAAES